MTTKKKIFLSILIPIFLYAILLIPDPEENFPQKAGGKPFVWNKDAFWQTLEEKFLSARLFEKPRLDSAINFLSAKAEEKFSSLEKNSFAPNDPRIDSLLNNFFSITPLIAVRQEKRDWLIDYFTRTRILLKKNSQSWDMNSPESRNALYKLNYGMRAAIEEVLLQSGKNFSPLMHVSDEPSATPATNIFGIDVHSGDMLVSRGGAEVSALISRGNDYPGNFSHVAMIYIDAEKKIPHLVEAHIERGVAISSAEQYIRDKKLRFMVLRPRADLPQLIRDPQLPQKAAKFSFDEAQKRHIPYDFKMNFYDSTAMFCSEVGSCAYRRNGIQLWQAVSTISSPGVVNWLNAFGVENFVTQMPSDLEYDPQLAVVAEWRDPETLLKDHIDNAVMDVLLERADRGEKISYNIWMLPIARIIKAYSLLKNQFGYEGKIPEGMSATRALKNNSFVEMHARVKEHLDKSIREFRQKNGYLPPYWQMVKLARVSLQS